MMAGTTSVYYLKDMSTVARNYVTPVSPVTYNLTNDSQYIESPSLMNFRNNFRVSTIQFYISPESISILYISILSDYT